ncbi:hypothetical protein AB205_0183620, partial [Aquarana catesbeiana]
GLLICKFIILQEEDSTAFQADIESCVMASVVDLKSKEEKDAELDRKIEALRKKNEALVKRHQLIEEDRKRAEQEGMAVTTPRKVKIPDGEPDKARKEKENFSITLDVSAGVRTFSCILMYFYKSCANNNEHSCAPKYHDCYCEESWVLVTLTFIWG